MTTPDHSDQGRTRGHDFGLPPDPVSQTKKVVPDRGKHVSRETGGPVGLTAQDAVADTALGRKLVEENKRRDKLKNVQLDRPESTRYITISNQKGGVGKTSTSVNLAVALAEQGQNVLVVDNDPQGNASTALGIPHGSDADSVYDILIDEVPVADVVKQSPESTSLWVLPATIDLAGAEIELVSVVAREQRLQRALAEYATAREEAGLPRLDYVFIDCPPSLGLLTINAFVAATEVLIPIQCEYYALEGLSQLLNNIKMIQRHLNPGLTVSNILLTMYDGRTNLASQVADEVRQHFPDEVMETMIPRSVRISEAPSYQQSVITYDPSSTGALSYLEAAAELASRAPTS
ncbi:ParA family protein [Kocuria salsicia]